MLKNVDFMTFGRGTGEMIFIWSGLVLAGKLRVINASISGTKETVGRYKLLRSKNSKLAQWRCYHFSGPFIKFPKKWEIGARVRRISRLVQSTSSKKVVQFCLVKIFIFTAIGGRQRNGLKIVENRHKMEILAV